VLSQNGDINELEALGVLEYLIQKNDKRANSIAQTLDCYALYDKVLTSRCQCLNAHATYQDSQTYNSDFLNRKGSYKSLRDIYYKEKQYLKGLTW
jgi:hypothetical protein